MSLEVTKRAGFVLRILSLMAFSCMILFAGIVVVQNEELGKLVPPSTARTLSILFAYIVAMMTFNYALAIKGRNFMGWRNEAYIVVGFMFLFVGMFLPHAFPTAKIVVTESWIPFSSKKETTFKADWRFSLVSVLSILFFYKAWRGISSMPLWKLVKENGTEQG